MHRMLVHLGWVVIAGLLAATGVAAQENAPSFDCAKASNAVERLLCTDAALAEQDRLVASLYQQAMARSGLADQALRLEQRRWLIARDHVCGRDVGAAAAETQAFQQSCLARYLSMRAAVLQAFPAADGPLDGSPCDRVAGVLPEWFKHQNLRDAGVFSLVTEGGIIDLAPTKPVSQDWQDKLPPSDDDTARLRVFSSDPGLVARFSVQGTANCTYLDYYHLTSSGVWAPLGERPGVKDERDGSWCWHSAMQTGEMGGHPIFIGTTEEIDHDSLLLEPLSASGWGTACRITARYTLRPVIAQSHCEGAFCGALQANAETWTAILNPWDGRGQRPALGGVAAQSLTEDRQLELADLPFPMEGDYGTQNSFELDAPFYRWDGPDGPLLLRISRATVGWRQSSYFVLGAWRDEDGKLRPVAAMMIRLRRESLSVTGP